MLADLDHQARWVTGRAAPPTLTDAIHWLVDDTWLDTKPAGSLVPNVFVNESEAAAIDIAVSALMIVLTSLGPARPDREYLQHARWPEVVAASAAALAMLTQSR